MPTRDRDSDGPSPDHPPVRKNLGQHFLTDRNILGRIVDSLELTGEETVVEIGPGRGSLTELLAPRVRRLVLIEYDRALAARLRQAYAADGRVEVIQADVLTVPLADAAGTAYCVVGNVPYYITTPIIFHALERPRARRAVFLVQREVAERMAAPAGAAEYGALSVNVQAVARVELLLRVAPGSFQPPPQVESTLVRLTPRIDPVISPDDEADFRAFVQAAFGMRRKQIRRVLREIASLSVAHAESALAEAQIAGDARPETLTPDDFARLARSAGRI